MLDGKRVESSNAEGLWFTESPKDMGPNAYSPALPLYLYYFLEQMPA